METFRLSARPDRGGAGIAEGERRLWAIGAGRYERSGGARRGAMATATAPARLGALQLRIPKLHGAAISRPFYRPEIARRRR